MPTTVTVKQAVAMPCPAAVPPRPAFPADAIAADADLWAIGTALWADRLAREAYELRIRAALEECTR